MLHGLDQQLWPGVARSAVRRREGFRLRLGRRHRGDGWLFQYQVHHADGGVAPSLRGALATKQSSSFRVRGSGLLRFARNDGVTSHSVPFASFHNASISSSDALSSERPCIASARSMYANRRSNFVLVPRSAISGSAPTWRARLTSANKRSPVSPASSSAH